MSEDTKPPGSIVSEVIVESPTEITISPLKIDGTSCVVFHFDKKVNHLLFDYDELEATFTAALEAFEGAESDLSSN